MEDMSDVSEVSLRLKSLRERAGLSIRDAAAALGMSPSSYGHYESRFKRPYLPADFAAKVAEVLAPSGVPSEDVMALAAPVSAAEPGGGVSREGALVPIFDVTASAGHGAALAENDLVEDHLSFPPHYLREITSTPARHLAIIRTKGDSMVPTIAEDDLVMVDMTKRDLSFDGVFVIRDDGASLLVKRIGRGTRRGHVMVISDNPRYAPTERPLAEIEVLGKVLWMGVKV